MIELLPSVFPQTEKEFHTQITAIKDAADFLQFDIADGKFVDTKSWYEPTIIATKMPCSFELHMMVENPLEEATKWTNIAELKRFVVHYETISDGPEKAIEILKQTGREITICLNKETPSSVLEPLLHHINAVQFMTIIPGRQGQILDRTILPKIHAFHLQHPSIIIEVDGGVNETTIKDLLDVGATRLCVGSALFKNERTPKENMQRLQQLVASLTT
jgi:ribulose-phosphate 3-epimerase